MGRHRLELVGEWLVVFLLFTPFALGVETVNNQVGSNGAEGGWHGRLLLAGPAGSGVQLANDTVYDCGAMSNTKGPFNITTDLVLSNVTFRNCVSGGALFVAPASANTTISVTLTNCAFFNNAATSASSSSTTSNISAGGALSIGSRVNARLLACTFHNNSAGMGGAVYSIAGSGGAGWLEVTGCSFRGNRGQGAALAVSGGVLAGITSSNFTSNLGGSAVYLYQLSQPVGSNASTQVDIAQSYFADNSADGLSSSSSPSNSTSDAGRLGAGMLIEKNYMAVRLLDCTFRRNTAMRQGGAITVTAGEKTVTLQSVGLYDNKAGLYGGALALSTSSVAKVSGCSFTNNSAVQAGAILATSMSVLELTGCNLTDNAGTKFGGAISATTGGELTLTSNSFLRNQAGFAGAVECTACNSLTATLNSFLDNAASSSGGALVMYSAAGSVSLTSNVFRNNSAVTNASSFTATDCSRSSSGAGGGACLSITTSTTLRNNTFDRNSATTGGALFISRQCDIQADDTTCATATANIQYDNILSSNTAVGGAGGAIFTPNISALTVSCLNTSNGKTVSYSGDQLPSWPYGTTGCNGTWYGNTATEGGYGAGLATGLSGLREAVGKGGSSRTNVSSNSALTVVLQLYDFMGTAITKGTYESSGTTVAVWLDPSQNLTRYMAGGYSVASDTGLANFSSLKLRAPPATYNLSFYALPIGVTDRTLYKWVSLSLEIRACSLGEVADASGEQCNECSGPSYFGFNAGNSSCDACPANAACNYTSSGSNSTEGSIGGYLVPEDGYWHSSPFSPQMLECPTSAACTYDLRNKTLGAFQEANLSVYDTNLPTPNTSVLYDIGYYWQLQCGTGYTGRLCGRCESPSYGWRSSGRCYECPSRALNTLFYVLSYLLTVALLAWTVRATLGRSLGESRALLRAVRSTTGGRLREGGRGSRRGSGGGGDGSAASAAASGVKEDDDDEEVVLVGGDRSGSGSRRVVNGGGGGAGGGSFFFAPDGDRSGSGRREMSGGGSAEFSRRSRTFSGGGSKRASFSIEAGGGGSGPPRSGSASRRPTVSGSGGLDGMGGISRKVSAVGAAGGGGILELAAAAAMAQLEAEAAGKGGGAGGAIREDDDDDSDPYGYGYGNGGGGGGYGGRMAGGAFAGALVVDPSQGSAAPLPPAVLPGMRPNIRSRVPRSVLARESRLANSSGGAGAVAGGVAAAGGGGDAGVVAPRQSEGSDGSDGEQAAAAAARRHRLSRMSRAADPAGAAAGAGAVAAGGGGGRRSGGSSGGSSGSGGGPASAVGPFNGPIAEGMSPVGGRSMDGGRVSGHGIAWSDGLRRRKPGEPEGVGLGEGLAGDGGGGSRRAGVAWGSQRAGESDGGAAGGGGLGSSRSWLDPVTSFSHQNTALRQQLKEDEAVREEKPPHAVVLKIMINFLQVTSVARNLNLDFPSFLKQLWNVGSMASSAMTTLVSIDCSLPTNGVPKAIQRTVLYVAVPWIFIALSMPVWLLLYGVHVRRRRRAAPVLAASAVSSAAASPTGRRFAAAPPTESPGAGAAAAVVSLRKIATSEKEEAEVELGRAVTSPRGSGGGGGGIGGGGGGSAAARPEEMATAVAAAAGPATFGSYMVTRVVVTTLIIIFYFYPSVTDAILSIYQCAQLDAEEGAYAGYLRSVGYFWELDYDLRCFRHSHLVLTLVVAMPGLVGWAVGVPVGSALWLSRNAALGRLNEQTFSDRFGFLYEDYRRTAYYWESVIMGRKLLVVGLLLATNSSEDIMQVLVVMGVVVVAGCLQLYFQPYEQARFNRLECFSLGSTLLVLYMCCFFLMDGLGDSAKQALSVFILVVYVGTLAWFVYCLAAEAWRYAVRVLDSDGDGRVTRGEVRAWLGLTLGGPLSRLVAFLAAPRWWRRRRRRNGGGGSINAAGAMSGKGAATAPPPPPPLDVVLAQPSPPASPSPMPYSLPLPSSPPPPQWLAPSSAAAVPLAVAAVAPTQLKLPPPSPPSDQAPQPFVAPQQAAAAADAAAAAPSAGEQAAGEPVYESYTSVVMLTPQELSPGLSPSPSGVAAGYASGGGGAQYGLSLLEPPPASTVLKGSSSAGTAGGGVGGVGVGHFGDIESGGLPGSTAPVAEALLAVPGSLPGSPLEGASRNGAGGGSGAAPSRGVSAASLGGSATAVGATSSSAASESRQGSRISGPSSRGGSCSGEAGGGGDGAGPRTMAVLVEVSRPGSPTGVGGVVVATAAAAAAGGGADANGRVSSR